jgi:hypothetical protein
MPEAMFYFGQRTRGNRKRVTEAFSAAVMIEEGKPVADRWPLDKGLKRAEL